jgi:hypothetical protein
MLLEMTAMRGKQGERKMENRRQQGFAYPFPVKVSTADYGLMLSEV